MHTHYYPTKPAQQHVFIVPTPQQAHCQRRGVGIIPAKVSVHVRCRICKTYVVHTQ